MTTTVYPIRDIQGNTRRYLEVETIDLSPVEQKEIPTIGHHIIVVDRSGSMYYDINTLKDSILKVLTVDEFQNPDLRVSLLSYSGEGDLTSHFERIAVPDVMGHNSPYRTAINQIRATGLTCISQALSYAADLALRSTDPNELQVVSLHSDGYANDRSPAQERRRIEELVERCAQQGLVVNTIAYNDYADFRMLSLISNGLGGKCVQARGLKGLYDALYDAQAVLAGSRTPAITIPSNGGYLVYHNRELGRLNGSETDMVLRGIPRNNMGTMYRFREVTDPTKMTVSSTNEPLYLLAQAYLQEGRLMDAKQILVSTGDQTLVDRHYRALTVAAVAEFSADLTRVIASQTYAAPGTTYQTPPKRMSVLEAMALLERNSKHLKVSLSEITKHYSRRSVKRLVGTRDPNSGEIVVPHLDTRDRRSDGMADLSGVEINHGAATINMRCEMPVYLVDRVTGATIEKVAGISLDDLRTYRQYTVVADGTLNLPVIPVQIQSKRTHTDLLDAGLIEAGDYDHSKTYLINLRELPLVNFSDLQGETFSLSGIADLLFRAKTLSKILSALQKGGSEGTAEYSAEQVQALKDHYLSTNLYLNFPTTTPYADLKTAISNGEIDALVGFDVELGSGEILSEDKLQSANKVIDRLYSVPGHDPKANKLSMNDYFTHKTWTHKTLSSRVRVTAADRLQMRVFDDFLGVASNGVCAQTLSDLGIQTDLRDRFLGLIGRTLTADKAREAIQDIARALDKAIDTLYRQKVCPVVFYLGCTGNLPEGVVAKVLTGEQYAAQYPDAKADTDSLYFELGDSVLAVTPSVRYVSVSR